MVASGQIFVLTLNRASALTVEGNEQNFLLLLQIVATIKRIGLESKQTAYTPQLPYFLSKIVD